MIEETVVSRSRATLARLFNKLLSPKRAVLNGRCPDHDIAICQGSSCYDDGVFVGVKAHCPREDCDYTVVAREGSALLKNLQRGANGTLFEE